ncbi:pyruvate kinase [Fistulifera solaris]|uniref:Pyruvate kinase n=1 Tax=Fistulifera solaris TaxID=1519565 RepID=A0A1Z5KH98_FISSO|nr:pyruvate kinase [Fistulifera solaris]|eukprot:GAX25694.1 pyruvate kinase [Fistulifera solaris]
MIANTGSAPRLQGGFITLDTVKNKTDVKNRRTKIVCTMGPASWSKEGLGKLMDAGMNVARLNFSHGDHEAHGATLARLREVAAEKSRNIAVLLDTKGPEIRTGFFAEGDKIHLVKGESIVLTSDYSFKGDAKKLACSYPTLATSVKPGQQILVADGSLVLTVLSCDEVLGEVSCRIENNASIGERKNMNLPGVVVDLPTFTEKDVHDIVEFGIRKGVEFIAASFIRKAEDVRKLRKLLADNGGSRIKIISKIENQEGLENYEEILEETDAVMVARGDLGMEIPACKVFLAQKYMIRAANIAGKPVITATQMLESMITNPRPTRAECSDVANAVYDGTDAVMLSGETANSPHFEAAVTVMSRTCCEAEGSRNYNLLHQSIRNTIVMKYGKLTVGESIASSAVKTSIDVGAKVIIVLSDSGKMAGYVAKFRPSIPVLMVTANLVAARQASGLLLGMHTILVDTLQKTDTLLDELLHELTHAGLSEGDTVCIMAGRMTQMKEQLQVFTVGAKDMHSSHGHIQHGGGFFFSRGLLLSYSA